MKIRLKINGLGVDAQFSEQEIETLHKPLLQRLTALSTAAPHKRTIIFLSAPPGTGKSTLTAFWQWLVAQDTTLPALQTLPMDGFHHYNDWLDVQGLRAYKGAPETFDVAKLALNLQRIREGEATWPQYDRQKHDPQEDTLQVTAPWVVVEGNWLLLADEKWSALREYCDFSIFITAPADVLRQRLIARKQAGGLSEQDALAFYQRTDGPNVERVLTHSVPADMTLAMDSKGGYRSV